MKARATALRILKRIRKQESYANLVLQAELEPSKQLSELDARLVTELVYGVLRWRRKLDWSLAECAPHGLNVDDDVHDILRVAAYEILFLRTPAYASVDEAVGLISKLRNKKLAGFANAILRRLVAQSDREPDARTPDYLGVTTSAPDWLVTAARQQLNEEQTREFLLALNQPAPVWIRVNRLRTTRDKLIQEIDQLGLSEMKENLPFAEAVHLQKAARFSHSDAFIEGRFSVQDLAAQCVAHLVAPQPGEKILDACAGTGGKTAHLAELSHDEAKIDCIDISDRKIELCRDHLRRLGIKNVRAQVGDLTQSIDTIQHYDRVLIDAPCTGSGVLRRHPEGKWRDPKDTAAIVQVQRRLLEQLSQVVLPGGVLVYAVCSFFPAEGSEQIENFLRTHSEFTVETPVEPSWQGLINATGALETWPHRHNADAFYAVRLRRKTS